MTKSKEDIELVLNTMQQLCKKNPLLTLIKVGEDVTDTVAVLLEEGEKPEDLKFWYDEFGFTFDKPRKFISFGEVYVQLNCTPDGDIWI